MFSFLKPAKSAAAARSSANSRPRPVASAPSHGAGSQTGGAANVVDLGAVRAEGASRAEAPFRPEIHPNAEEGARGATPARRASDLPGSGPVDRRADRSAAAQESSEAPAPPPGAVAAKEALDRLGLNHISTSLDLPPGATLQSMKGGKHPLPPKMQESLAVFELEDGKLFFVVEAAAVNMPQIKSIERGIKKDSNKTVETTYTAERGFIASLYAVSDNPEEDASKSKMKQALQDLVFSAYEADVSDIHMKKETEKFSISFRRNGRLFHQGDWSPSYGGQFIRALYTFAEEGSKDISYQENGSQQMSVDVALKKGKKAKLRVQTTTSFPDGGMKVVMRVLKVGATSRVKSFAELGYAADHETMLDYMMSSPSGLTIIAAPTGSGKTTTLQTLMTSIAQKDPNKALYSIEDPPEYVMPGVVQIPVKRMRGVETNPFTQAMKDVMRLDPDDIMVGEVRDKESVDLITAMVMSGHKAFSTTHAGSALEIFARLSKMAGTDAQTLTEDRFISGLIFQKLVPVLCDECKVEYDSSMDLGKDGIHERIHTVTVAGDTLFVAKEGEKGSCPKCNGEGVVGRTVCAEMIVPDHKLLTFIREGKGYEARKYWEQMRTTTYATAQEALAGSMTGVSAIQHGVLKMRLGKISPVDLEAELGYLTGYQQNEGVVSAETEDFLKDSSASEMALDL
jgi:type II secretory ATPase GspE/PulE/Tfp pilus assembly ATPase PilB-like protein